MSAEPEARFSLSLMASHFEKCSADPRLSVDEYLLGYDQLLLFLRSLSKAFYFVVQDVEDKMRILRERRAGEEADGYATVAAMLELEAAGGFRSNGSRTLLRLHRALQFIERLLGQLANAEAEQSMSKIAGDAYYATLSKHHGWTVRQAVGFALYLLPARDSLLQQMANDNQCEPDAVRGLVNAAAPALRKVYDATQLLYEQHSALQLP